MTESTSLPNLVRHNPLRYRGYVYDQETELYYLQSRYYNPKTGRFLNADAFAATGQGLLGNNMFAYCNNNPVNYVDPTGHMMVYRSLETHGAGIPYITNQEETNVGDQSLGIVNVSHGGCGPVSIYNALLSMGDYTPFSEVLDYFNSNPAKTLTALGLLGTLPSNIAQYFTDHGYTVVMTNDRDAINVYSKVAHANIMFITFPSMYGPIEAIGAHFIEYHRSGNGYIGCNISSSTPTASFSYPTNYMYGDDTVYAIGIFVFK